MEPKLLIPRLLLCLFLLVSFLSNNATAKPFDLFDWFGEGNAEDDGADAEASVSAAETKSGSVSLEGPLGSISANGAIGGSGSVSVGDESAQQGAHSNNFNSPDEGAFAGSDAGPQGAEGIAGTREGQQFQQRPMEGRPSQWFQNRGPSPPYSQQVQPYYGQAQWKPWSGYGNSDPTPRRHGYGGPPTMQRPPPALPPPYQRPYQGHHPEQYQGYQSYPQQKPTYIQPSPSPQGYRPPQGYY